MLLYFDGDSVGSLHCNMKFPLESTLLPHRETVEGAHPQQYKPSIALKLQCPKQLIGCKKHLKLYWLRRTWMTSSDVLATEKSQHIFAAAALFAPINAALSAHYQKLWKMLVNRFTSSVFEPCVERSCHVLQRRIVKARGGRGRE